MEFIKKSLLALCLSLTFATCASVPTPHQKELEKIEYFSVGMNGFIGHISEGEKIYRNILKDNNAEKTFLTIFESETSTNEARLYAACGLYALHFQKINSLSGKGKNEYVSVLSGDILYKKKFDEVLNSITTKGCQ